MSKILIIDDHPLFCESLSGILSKLKFKGVYPQVFTAINGKDAIAIIKKNKNLDLILTDIDIPDINGLNLLKEIKKMLPNTIIVMVSGSEKNTDVKQALKYGAKGFIQKSSETNVLLAALQLILAGGTYLPPLLLEEQIEPIDTQHITHNLTTRQMDILRYLHKGFQNKIIAYELDLSEATVKVHVRHIFSVLGVKNRTQAVQKALGLGIL